MDNQDNNRQSLADIIKAYAKMLGMDLADDGKSITHTDFYKETAKRLKNILSAFEIDIRDYLSHNTKSYFFNDSQEEIITMLNTFDNFLIKKIRLKKLFYSKSLLSNNTDDDTMSEADEFMKALKGFMEKNDCDPLKDFSEYKSKEEFTEDLIDNIDKIATYEKNQARLNSNSTTHVKIINTLLDIVKIINETLEYTQETTTYDAMNDEFVLNGLNILRQDLQSSLNKYRKHFDCLFNEKVLLYPDFTYEPFPFFEYNSEGNDNEEKDKDNQDNKDNKDDKDDKKTD